MTAPSMFTKLCLVLLLLFADSPLPKCHFQSQKKKKKKTRESPGKGRTQHNLADGVTASAQFYGSIEHRARSFSQ